MSLCFMFETGFCWKRGQIKFNRSIDIEIIMLALLTDILGKETI